MDFVSELTSLINQIPKGMVSGCGDLARALGDVKASAAVGRLVSQRKVDGPLHRVIRKDGGIVLPDGRRRLRREGLKLAGNRVVNPEEAIFTALESSRPLERLKREQKRLANRVVVKDSFDTVETVSAVDVAYTDDRGYSAAVSVDHSSHEVVEAVTTERGVDFPYIPTYLAYREFPLIESCIRRLEGRPDVLLIDGNGILHPRGLGLATFAGIKLGIPTIGVAKSLLLGNVEDSLAKPGSACRVLIKGEMRGYAFRPAQSRKPIYISPGHMVSFETSLEIVKSHTRNRVPEPLKLAHNMAVKAREEASDV